MLSESKRSLGASLARPQLFSVAPALFCFLLCGCAHQEKPRAVYAPVFSESPESVARGIPGAWRGRVSFRTGSFAAVKDLEFMYVFNVGGTLTESSNYDGAPPVPPAYGVWRKLSASAYEARYAFYVTRPPASFDEIVAGSGWLPAGHGILTEHITLAPDQNSFNSTITYEPVDLQGKPVEGGGQGEVVARRMDF